MADKTWKQIQVEHFSNDFAPMQSLLCISMEAIVIQTNNLLFHPPFLINKYVNIGSYERDLTQAKYQIDSLAPVSR